MRLPEPIVRVLTEERPKIAVTGASGWFGRTALSLLWEALGPGLFQELVCAFASSDKRVALDYDRHAGALVRGPRVPAQPLEALARMDDIDYVLHFAGLTKEKTSDLGVIRYWAQSRRIAEIVRGRLGKGGVKGIFFTSSGAVYGSKGTHPYGAVKRYEEGTLSDACRETGTRCLILRVFSVTGAYMTKPGAYALGDFIQQVLQDHQLVIRSERPVWRSYTAVEDLIVLGFAQIIEKNGRWTECVDTCGDIVEIGTLAREVLSALNALDIEPQRHWRSAVGGDVYVGRKDGVARLMEEHRYARTSFPEQIAATVRYLKAVAGYR